ncbi:glutamate receptor ionotropic, kainate 4-like [Tubulanus polymorphus]|uniref:glutamate receptor ionotropic, kainate 4-like n=1 Tax=Tubulanus polymorphus TaxID=672921 RepID=UPI003DA34848
MSFNMNKTTYNKDIKRLIETENRFLLICSLQNIQRIFGWVHQHGIYKWHLTDNYWLIVGDNYNHAIIEDFLHDGDNVLVIDYAVNKKSFINQVVWIVASVQRALNETIKSGVTEMNKSCRYSQIAWPIGKTILDNIETPGRNDSQQEGSIDVMTASVRQHPTFSTVHRIRNIKQLERLEVLYPMKTYGFCNRTFHVMSIEYFPYHFFNFKTGKWEGIVIDLLIELSKRMNFSYVISPAPDNTWGVPKNGTWNGMIGALIKKETDMLAVILTVTAERNAVLDYTTPFLDDKTIMVIKKSTSENIFLFLSPFSNMVWYCSIIAVPTIGLLLALFTRITPHRGKQKNHPLKEPKHSIWYTLGSIVQQGGVHLPEALSGRLLVALWWGFVIVLLASYSGSLVAYLSLQNDKPFISKINELPEMREKGYKYGVLKDAALQNIFQLHSHMAQIYNYISSF